MKSKNLNGHIMSEKEMKEVKGGYIIGLSPIDTIEQQPEKCPKCETEFNGHYKFKNGKLFCTACSCIIQVGN